MIVSRWHSDSPLPSVHPAPPPADARIAFRLAIQDREPVFLAHPLFAERADAGWFMNRAWNGILPVGRRENRSFIRCDLDKFVVLHRLGEGVIFGADGACNSPGFLDNMETMPAGMRREGGHIVVDEAVLSHAPRLAGCTVIFYNGNLQNYYHWLVEGMIALTVLDNDMRLGDRVVLPATLPRHGGFDHLQLMRLLGHDRLPIERVASPYVRLDKVLHLEHGGIDEIPVNVVQSLRAKVARTYASGGGNRICVLRRHLRCVVNQPELDAILAPLGFRSYGLEQMPLEDQIRLFADAEIVIGPHGAGLSNLLFAPPGCKVIELMPACEMRPFFWQIGAKLEHVYGMLPCPTDDGGFNGHMTVDLDRFQALLTMVQAQR